MITIGKLKPLPTKEVIRILEKHGFVQVRMSKHTIFKKTLPSGKVLTTWVPKGNEVTVFVLQYIMKQTEIPRESLLINYFFFIRVGRRFARM